MKLLRPKVAVSYSMLIVSFLFCFSAFSQISYQGHTHNGHVRCATTQMDSIRHAEDPMLQTNQEFEEWVAKLLEQDRKRRESALIIDQVYYIPVVVHVIHDGDAVGTGDNLSQAVIQSQIDVLNEDFRRILGTNGYNTHPVGADTQIEFCLAQRRPDGSAFPGGENGINRVDRNATPWGIGAPPYTTAEIDGTIKPWSTGTDLGGWDPADYMNFWVVQVSGGVLGYAQFPTTSLGGMGCGAQPVSTDGVVMTTTSIGKSAVTGFPGPYNEGRTATHEIGHWLGLRHIWGDGPCTVDDFCADTPLSDAANFGCATTNSCVDAYSTPPWPTANPNDMVENYMDYSDDLCMNIFTQDQKARMRIVLENSPIRASLITSDACIPPAPDDASVIAINAPLGDNCPGVVTPEVVLKNRGGNTLTSATIEYSINGGAPVTFSWTGSIASGGTANVTLPGATPPLGIHTLQAWSSLPNGVADPDPTFDSTSVDFAVSNGIQPDFTEDFESGTFPTDVRWLIDNPNGDCMQWIGQSGTSNTGVTPNDAACAAFFNNNGSAQEEYLYTPIFILPCNAASAQVSFDHAYRRRVNASSDRLRLQMSLDCGATWTNTLFDQQGNALSTGANSNSYWIPSAAGDWQNNAIDLTPFVTGASQNIQFRFRATNVGNQGGNIHVDNFQYTAVTPGEIEVDVAGTNVLDGGYYDFGANPVGGTVTAVFTINNPGTSPLILTGPINVTGAEYALNTTFGTTTVPAGGSTTFSIDFTPTGGGPFLGTVSFGTNDCDEALYDFVLTGTGDVQPPLAGFTSAPSSICEGQTVTYTSTATGATTYSWSFPGGTPNTATGVGPHTITYNTAGTYNASQTVTNPYGTDTDNQTNVVTVASGTGTALPITEGFDGGTFPPTGWSIGNGGNGAVTWAQDPNNNGTAPTPGNSASINLFTTNTAGDQDSLFVIPADFTGLTSAQMTFDVAYARYSAAFADSLEVLVSSDCGNTWALEYAKGPNTNLATDPDQTGGYTAPATWRNETVDLSAYIGNSNVRVAFVAVSGWGQYVYVDNVNLTGVAGCNDPDVPTVTFTPGTYCEGDVVTLNIAGNLNDATQWAIYSGSCGGTLLGTTATGTFDVTLAAGTNDYFVRGEGGCVTPGTCGTTSITAGAIPAAPTVTVVDNCGSSTLTATGTNLLWSTGETTASITVTTGGVYTVTQTVGGCTSPNGSGTANPTPIPAAPTVTVVDNCGSSTLTATGTNLLWSTGETTASITVTTGGVYTVTQTVGGCTSPNGSGTANPTPIPAAPTVTVVDNCGSSTLTATGTNLLWSTGETTASITVTTGGVYTVTQTVGGCTSPNGSGTANPTPIPAAPTVTVVDNCGSSTLTATGTNLLWSTGETTASITVTTGGVYTVTQTVGGCTSPNGSGTANPTPIPPAPTVSVNDNCGSSTLTVLGTNLLWSTGETTASITVTTPGVYTVTQTVGGCTSAPGSGTAAPLTGITITAGTLTDPSSCGGNDGSIVVNGTGTGTVTWTGTSSGNSGVVTLPYTITGLTAGSYAITFDDGCPSNTLNETLSDPAAPAAPTVTVVDNCGSSTLTATGTNLLWSTGETTASITVTTGGVYTVTQTVGGCTSAAGSGTANPTPIPPAPTVSVTDNCGSSTLTVLGTNLLWSTGETTASITVTTPGVYTVTQTVGGCTSAPGSGTAAPLTIPTITAGTLTDPSTCGNNDGSIVVNGTGTGTVTWAGTSSGNSGVVTLPYTITGLTAGSYAITFDNGCPSNTLNETLSDPAAPAAPTVTVVDNCGSSTLTATGTNLLWSTGETTASITVTTGGVYTVTQTVGGCTSAAGSGTANPTPIPPAPTVSVTDNCGSSTLTVLGTNLLWSTGETTASITVTTPGVYTVTQTVGGCTSAPGSGTAAPLTIPTITAGTLTDPSTCGNNDGSIVVNGTGTGTVTWTGTSSGNSGVVTLPYTITGLTAGSYAITFDNGCPSNTLNETLSDPAAPAAPTVTVVDNCGSSTLTATGTNLLWSTGETTASITVTTGGVYTVTQTVGGCTSAAGSGTANPTPIPSTPVVTVVNNCGSSTLTTSGTNLLWSTGETTASITVTTPGLYTVTQTVGGCLSIAGSGTAAPLATPTITAGTLTDPSSCGNNDGSIVVNGTGTGTVTWTGTSSGNSGVVTLPYTITGLTAGSYAITFDDGCPSNTLNETLSDPSAPAAPTVTVLDGCGSSTLTATGTNLLWSTGETTASITVTTGGVYTVTQTVGGCTSAAGSGTANPTPIPAAPTVTVVDNCGSSTLTATGTNLLWSTGETTASITVTTAGVYTVTQTVGGCTSSNGSGTAAPLAIPATPVVTVVDNCGSSILTTSGTNLLWSTGETTTSITVTTGGLYTVTQTVGGCTSIAGSGTANPTPIPAAPTVTVVDGCGSSTLTATGTNLLWSTGETTASITVTTGGVYTVTQTVGGCTSAAGSGTANPTPIPAAPTVSVTDNCGSSTLTVLGTNLLWSTGETTASITVTTPGVYTVTQTVGGCTSAPGTGVASPLTIPAAPTISVSDNCGSSTLTVLGTNLLWSTGETTASITVTTGGVYTVTQTVGGCTSAPGSATANPLTVPAPTSENVTACGSYTWSATGTTYTSGGSYTTTIPATNGCDSTVTLNLTINTPTTGSETASACDFYTWPTSGLTYTSTGAYTTTLVGSNGCDSIVTLNLTINTATSGTETATVCDQYVWAADGNTYTTTGTYTAILTNAAGCDSVVTLDLTVQGLPSVVLALTVQEFCDSADPVTLAGGTPAGGTYSGPGVTGGTFSPGTAGIGSHTITYSYTDANGCSATDTDVITVQDCANIDELEIDIVTIYPNPTTGSVTLESNGAVLEEVRIFDNAGKLIDVITLGGIAEEINLTNYARGVYQFQIKTGTGMHWDRVVKH